MIFLRVQQLQQIATPKLKLIWEMGLLNTSLYVVDVLRQVLRPSPRRGEEDDVRAVQRRDQLEEVSHDELDALLDAVDAGVVPRQPDLLRVDVDGDDALAGEGELDRVAADAAETVHDEVAAAPEERKFFFENIESLRRHTML